MGQAFCFTTQAYRSLDVWFAIQNSRKSMLEPLALNLIHGCE